MLWYIFGSGVICLIGILGIIVVYHESKNPNVMIIDDAIERQRIRKFLNLTERQRQRVVGELEHGD